METTVLSNLAVDKEGFLVNPNDWTNDFAAFVANQMNLTLTEKHWEVINYMRKEFLTTGETPSVRKITKSGIVSMKEIYELFPGGPAKIPAKIGGIPKPKGCI